MDFNELEAFVQRLGLKKFRAVQIAKWIYKKGVLDFSQMTDISKADRQLLSASSEVKKPKLISREVSADKTQKFLFELADGSFIESVFIPERKWNTLCISTQVGCPIGCKFCLTAKGGFKRNLKVSEIVGQYIAVQNLVGWENRISNVVFMGMGEPLLNYENVKKAVEIMISDKMLGLSNRKVSISTVGIIPKIYKMAKELSKKARLAVSLHATTDETRQRLIPVARKYPLKDLMKALRSYPANNIRRIMIEYLMLEGINDTQEDALRLAELLKGIPVKVNLIPFNPYPGSYFKRPPMPRIEKFQALLRSRNIATFIREPRGQDISAACGMLKGKFEAASRKEHPKQDGGVRA